MNLTHILRPWVTFNHKFKGLPGQITYQSTNKAQQSCTLIAILSVPRQQLDLISFFQFAKEQPEQTVLAYLSQTIHYQQHPFRFIYVPPNKNQHPSVLYFSDIIRELADYVINDANFTGIHRLKDKNQLENQQFVLVNGKDIYQVGLRQNKIQLLKRIQTPLWNNLLSMGLIQSPLKQIQLKLLYESLNKYTKSWELLLENQKSWSILSTSAVNYYKVQKWLSLDCQKFRLMRQQGHMLSTDQLQLLYQDLISNSHTLSSFHQVIFRQVSQQILTDIKLQNSKQIVNFLNQIKQSSISSSVRSIQQLKIKGLQIAKTLQLYDMPHEYVQFVTFPKEKQLLHQQFKCLKQEKEGLNSKITEYEQKLKQKNHQINEFKLELGEYSQKVAHLIQTEQKLSENIKLLNQQKHRTKQLTLELQAHVFLERKGLQFKTELQTKLQSHQNQKEGMLECLHQLTQQNLSSISKIDELKLEIEELKQKIQQSRHIQIRALRSIENEAQIKTRLQRYENYVKQLKYSIQTYRKLESQKFNHILAQNYKQYTFLQEILNSTSKELKNSQTNNKELNNNLQRQKIRIAYFQKILMSSYQNESIPQCSEENSATDRQSRVPSH